MAVLLVEILKDSKFNFCFFNLPDKIFPDIDTALQVVVNHGDGLFNLLDRLAKFHLLDFDFLFLEVLVLLLLLLLYVGLFSNLNGIVHDELLSIIRIGHNPVLCLWRLEVDVDGHIADFVNEHVHLVEVHDGLYLILAFSSFESIQEYFLFPIYLALDPLEVVGFDVVPEDVCDLFELLAQLYPFVFPEHVALNLGVGLVDKLVWFVCNAVVCSHYRPFLDSQHHVLFPRDFETNVNGSFLVKYYLVDFV